MPIEALVPIIALSIAWLGYCLADLRRSEVAYFPKWAWALVIFFSVPFGGLVYLIVGRRPGSTSPVAATRFCARATNG